MQDPAQAPEATSPHRSRRRRSGGWLIAAVLGLCIGATLPRDVASRPTEEQVYQAFFARNTSLKSGNWSPYTGAADSMLRGAWPCVQNGMVNGTVQVDTLWVGQQQAGEHDNQTSYSTTFNDPRGWSSTSEVGQQGDVQAALLSLSPVEVNFRLRQLTPDDQGYRAAAEVELPVWSVEESVKDCVLSTQMHRQVFNVAFKLRPSTQGWTAWPITPEQGTRPGVQEEAAPEKAAPEKAARATSGTAKQGGVTSQP